MDELMIQVENVSKQYKLGQIGGTTLRDELQRVSAKLRGKEDPTKMIGARDYTRGETFMALDGITFDVKKGERIGIIGHNGAGKSTLLKLVSRITAPTSGAIGLNGRVASMLEVGTGFHPELTGRENIYMNGTILGMSRKEIDAKMEDIIDFSECRQFIDTPVKRYSSGMYVKLAFSVAAHLNSEILIMDEVLAVGDMAFQKKCLDKMNDVSKTEGRTILYVSHNMSTIRQLCDRVIVLDHGKMIFDGDVEEGIGLYINKNDDMAMSYDYSRYRRVDDGKSVYMKGLDIIGRDRNSAMIGEKVNALLHCKANEAVSDISLRFEVYYADGTVAGTAFSDKTISADAGETFDLRLSVSTENLAPGRYRYVALLFESNGYGGQTFIDRVEPAMVLELADPQEGALVWTHRFWGHVRFDDILIEEKTAV